MKEYCLNVSKKYCPEWGTWEVARELYANAKDADSNFSIETPDKDTLIIHTKTVPDLGDVFIIGAGTKDEDSGTIGIFGEGLKIAALAASRKLGSSLKLRLPGCRISFEFREHLGHEVLYAIKEEAEDYEGYCCILVMEDAGRILDERVRESTGVEIISKSKEEAGQIYCKGIWICQCPEQSLFSYNLPNLSLNRDRSHAEPFSIKSEIGKALLRNMDKKIAKALIKERQCFEAEKCLEAVSFLSNTSSEKILEEAFLDQHGQGAVIGTHPANYERCQSKGYRPVIVGKGIEELLQGIIPRDFEVLNREDLFDETEVNDSGIKEEFKYLCKILELDMPEIKWFKDNRGEQLGAFVKPNVVWLNERLVKNHFERIKVFLHEVAHYQGQGADISSAFEYSLTLLLGRLGVEVLENRTVLGN